MGELDGIRRRQVAAATKATEQWADAVLGQSQRIVPTDEGTLAGTADRETKVTPAGVTVTLSYGTAYAQRQHEQLDYTHKAGRQAKFLEAPFKQAIPRYLPIVKAAVAKATGGR